MSKYQKINTNDDTENTEDSNNTLMNRPLAQVEVHEDSESEEENEVVEPPVVEAVVIEEEKPEEGIVVPPTIGAINDGVFSNLSAKPEAQPAAQPATTNNATLPAGEWDGESEQLQELPGYNSVMLDPSPPCFDESTHHARDLSGLNIDDLLVEGLPVGGLISFVWNALVSSMFRYVGFVLTYLLHINHAGRLGSLVGLGITLLKHGLEIRGIYLKINIDQFQEEDIQEITDLFAVDGSLPPSTIWFAYILMIIGFLIILKCSMEYVRLRKQQSDLLSNPENGIQVVSTSEA